MKLRQITGTFIPIDNEPPINLEEAILDSQHKLDKAPNGSRERSDAYKEHKILLEAYHAVFGRKYAIEPAEPNDWIDTIGGMR